MSIPVSAPEICTEAHGAVQKLLVSFHCVWRDRTQVEDNDALPNLVFPVLNTVGGTYGGYVQVSLILMCAARVLSMHQQR